MTNEMKKAMEQGKAKLFNVSSKIEIQIPVSDDTKKYRDDLKELFGKNFVGVNSYIPDGFEVIESACEENQPIKDILDDVVKICFAAKDVSGKDVIVTINGVQTTI